MIAKHLKRWLGGVAIAGLTLALARPAVAQTSGTGAPVLSTGTSVNVGGPSSTQLNRAELNDEQELHDQLEENTHHDRIDEELDSEDRNEDARHQMRVQQLEAAQTPLKPQHIADENEYHADIKKEIAEKKSIEAARHQQALAAIMAAAKSLLSGAASALGNAANGGGSPAGSSPASNGGGGSPGTTRYAGGAPNNPAIGASGSPGNPRSGGSSGDPNTGGSTAGNPSSGSGSPANPNSGSSSAGNPSNASGSASNPSLSGSAASNAVGAGVSPGNPTLAGGASSNANASNASSSSPGAGSRPLDFIPNTVNSLLKPFPNSGQNLQNASNALRGVAQTFEDQWTKPNGGINQVVSLWAFHGVGGAIEALAPAIRSIVGEAGAAAPGLAAKARAAAPGIAARAKNYVAKLFGAAESDAPGAVNAGGTAPGTLNGPVKAGESVPGALNPGEPGANGAGEPPHNPPLNGEVASNGGGNAGSGVSENGGAHGNGNPSSNENPPVSRSPLGPQRLREAFGDPVVPVLPNGTAPSRMGTVGSWVNQINTCNGTVNCLPNFLSVDQALAGKAMTPVTAMTGRGVTWSQIKSLYGGTATTLAGSPGGILSRAEEIASGGGYGGRGALLVEWPNDTSHIASYFQNERGVFVVDPQAPIGDRVLSLTSYFQKFLANRVNSISIMPINYSM